MAESLEGTVSQPSSVTQPVTSELADFNQFIKYIKRVVPVLLEDDDDIHPSLLIALDDKNNIEILKKFIGDPQCRAVLIQRSSSKGIYFCIFANRQCYTTSAIPLFIKICNKLNQTRIFLF